MSSASRRGRLDDVSTPDLLPEESEYLVESERCEACGHLEALHQWDRELCGVPSCPCDCDKLPTEEEIDEMWWLDLPRNRGREAEKAMLRKLMSRKR
jgi:hypothetical protein